MKAELGGAGASPPHHRVVAAHDDGAVVDQESVGDAGQTLDGLVVGDDQGLAVGVGAGHHEQEVVGPSRQAVPAGGRRPVPEQEVERRCRQHRPSQARPGAMPGSSGRPGERTMGGGRGRRSRPASAGRPGRRCQEAAFQRHDGKGLWSRCLRARSSTTAAALQASQARWETAQAFEGDDLCPVGVQGQR